MSFLRGAALTRLAWSFASSQDTESESLLLLVSRSPSACSAAPPPHREVLMESPEAALRSDHGTVLLSVCWEIWTVHSNSGYNYTKGSRLHRLTGYLWSRGHTFMITLLRLDVTKLVHAHHLKPNARLRLVWSGAVGPIQLLFTCSGLFYSSYYLEKLADNLASSRITINVPVVMGNELCYLKEMKRRTCDLALK